MFLDPEKGSATCHTVFSVKNVFADRYLDPHVYKMHRRRICMYGKEVGHHLLRSLVNEFFFLGMF